MARISWRAVASLGVALLAGTSAYVLYLDATASLPVVVATQALQAPLKIEPGMVAVSHVPAAAVHPEAVSDPAAVVGRVLRRDVEAGEPLLAADVAAGQGAGLSLYLEEGQQAFFIPARLEQGLGGAVEPGDRVDVIFVGGEGPGAVARTLLENLPVLQVRDEEGRRWEEGRPMGVLVAVSRDQAERLAYALTYGRVFLALAPAAARSGGSAGVTWDNLFVPPLPAAGGGTGPASGSPAGAGGTASTAAPVPPGAGQAGNQPPGPAGAPIPLVDPAWVGEGEDAP
ncbi:Flp pilus assembly protein CpaB [Thermaerobacter marianensis DSM 12885]|uniref:Flp pilus assembly protein CpaB n=1 Tax=Thermaerobacter marianensis (strain ATCC 700841 / DSM 12885 / JCM 10246 / 7p75a) TaxID=644966 RepID=E6SL86_THEM7|nr:Flp pilus assembly protein CpaB [Thermaerobacter marianensis]ADU51317.1 Flp pilus assembly protein CpaB [Thermaerobacter marianensis DSM 12885]